MSDPYGPRGGVWLHGTSQGKSNDIPPDEWIERELIDFDVKGRTGGVRRSDLVGTPDPIFDRRRWTITDERFDCLKQSILLATKMLRDMKLYFSVLLPDAVQHRLGPNGLPSGQPLDPQMAGSYYATPAGHNSIMLGPQYYLREGMFEDVTRTVLWTEDRRILRNHGWFAITNRAYPKTHTFEPEDPNEIRESDYNAKNAGHTTRVITVAIASEYLDKLQESTLESEQHLITAFHLATTLVHELAHVVYHQNFRHFDEYGIEPWVNDDARSELGLAFTSHLFGGWNIDPIVLGKDLSTLFENGLFCSRQERNRRESWTRNYSVPLTWVERMMTQATWDDPEFAELGTYPRLLAPETPFVNGKHARTATCNKQNESTGGVSSWAWKNAYQTRADYRFIDLEGEQTQREYGEEDFFGGAEGMYGEQAPSNWAGSLVKTKVHYEDDEEDFESYGQEPVLPNPDAQKPIPPFGYLDPDWIKDDDPVDAGAPPPVSVVNKPLSSGSEETGGDEGTSEEEEDEAETKIKIESESVDAIEKSLHELPEFEGANSSEPAVSKFGKLIAGSGEVVIESTRPSGLGATASERDEEEGPIDINIIYSGLWDKENGITLPFEGDKRKRKRPAGNEGTQDPQDAEKTQEAEALPPPKKQKTDYTYWPEGSMRNAATARDISAFGPRPELVNRLTQADALTQPPSTPSRAISSTPVSPSAPPYHPRFTVRLDPRSTRMFVFQALIQGMTGIPKDAQALVLGTTAGEMADNEMDTTHNSVLGIYKLRACRRVFLFRLVGERGVDPGPREGRGKGKGEGVQEGEGVGVGVGVQDGPVVGFLAGVEKEKAKAKAKAKKDKGKGKMIETERVEDFED